MSSEEFRDASRLHSAHAVVITSDQDIHTAKRLVESGIQVLTVLPSTNLRSEDDERVERFLDEFNDIAGMVAHLPGTRLADATRVWKGRSARLRGSRNFIVTPLSMAVPSARVFRAPDELGESRLVVGEFLTVSVKEVVVRHDDASPDDLSSTDA